MIGLIIRSTIAIIASLAVAFILVIGVEAISAIFHPFPPGVDPTDYEACKAHVAKYPPWLLFVCAILWGLIAFVGPWLATRLGAARHPAHGIAVGSVLLLAAGFNMLLLPYPIWFKTMNPLVFVAATFVGTRLGRGKRPQAAEEQAAN